MAAKSIKIQKGKTFVNKPALNQKRAQSMLIFQKDQIQQTVKENEIEYIKETPSLRCYKTAKKQEHSNLGLEITLYMTSIP